MRTKSGNDDQGYGVRSGVEFCDEPAVVVGGVILRDRLPSEQSETLRGVRGSCMVAASDQATVGVGAVPGDAADVQLCFPRGVQQPRTAAAAYGVASSQPTSSGSTAMSRPAKRGSRSSPRSSRSVFISASASGCGAARGTAGGFSKRADAYAATTSGEKGRCGAQKASQSTSPGALTRGSGSAGEGSSDTGLGESFTAYSNVRVRVGVATT